MNSIYKVNSIVNVPDTNSDLWWPLEELAVGGNVVVSGGGEEVLPGAGLGGAGHVQQVLHGQLQLGPQVPAPTHHQQW